MLIIVSVMPRFDEIIYAPMPKSKPHMFTTLINIGFHPMARIPECVQPSMLEKFQFFSSFSKMSVSYIPAPMVSWRKIMFG
jgi:hypothetical protein